MINLFDPEPWMDGAVCAQTDPESFYPEKGGSTHEAKAVCLSCDVREACLEYALRMGERYGIWGGKSERERRKLAKQQKVRRGDPHTFRCGHPKSAENTQARKDGTACRTCVREHNRRAYARQKAEREAAA